MASRREIILEILKEQYPQVKDSLLEEIAENLDRNWHILKRRSLDGVNNEWTLSGHVQSAIWDQLAQGAQSAAAAHRILRRLAEEDVAHGSR